MEEFKKVPREEQETSISLTPDDKVAYVYSSDPAVVRRLLKYVEEYPDVCKLDIRDDYGLSVTMPKEWVLYKPRKKRVMSEESRLRAIERLAKARKPHAVHTP